jgi:hypothetical protein
MTPGSRPGGFEGDLEALSVVEIVQTLSLGSKTARVLLRSSTGMGTLWFQNGAMTHAAAGPLFGELAVYAMIEWKVGRFLVECGVTSENRSIAGDTTHVLLEGLRQVDERLSSPSPQAERAEAPRVLGADLTRKRPRRLVIGVTACGMIVGVIATAALRDGQSPSLGGALAAGGAVAVVAAPDPAVPRATTPEVPSATRFTPTTPKRQPRSEKPVDVSQPRLVAPESPLAEEPVPDVTLAKLELAPR